MHGIVQHNQRVYLHLCDVIDLSHRPTPYVLRTKTEKVVEIPIYGLFHHENKVFEFIIFQCLN
jgi:hypothetical protein